MKPEKILQSDVLDIIFENRNKEYGAYELRKSYNNRAGKALAITTLIVLAFGFMQSFKAPKKTGKVFLEGPVVSLEQMPEEKKVEDKIKEEPKEKQVAKEKAIEQPIAYEEVKFNAPKIVDEDFIEPIMAQANMDDKAIGNNNKPGELGNPGENIQPQSKGTGTEAPSEEAVLPTGPLPIAEFMPEFPGGKTAFLNFMQRNLHQPDDLEEGEKLVVIARFVVNAEGEIVDINISQNARKDLDAEVVRVIKKMPRWKPGVQNGRNVSVYFSVPVTFVAP